MAIKPRDQSQSPASGAKKKTPQRLWQIMQIPQANYKTRLQSPGSQKHPADSDRCLATNFNVFAY